MRYSFALVLLLAGAGAAEAQDARLVSRLHPSALGPVSAIIDSVRAAALPTEPLVQKALEGASKGAHPHRIVTATRMLSQGLHQACEIFGPETGRGVLTSAAVALRLGAAPAALARLQPLGTEAELEAGLIVVVDLMQRGVRADTAAVVVQTALAAALAAPDLLGLRQIIEHDIRSGISPGLAATSRARAAVASRRH